MQGRKKKITRSVSVFPKLVSYFLFLSWDSFFLSYWSTSFPIILCISYACSFPLYSPSTLISVMCVEESGVGPFLLSQKMERLFWLLSPLAPEVLAPVSCTQISYSENYCSWRTSLQFFSLQFQEGTEFLFLLVKAYYYLFHAGTR